MKPFSERNPVLIAINGLTLIVVLMVVAMSFNRLPLISGTTYRAQFTDASGLVKGEEVRIAGIKVGAVTDIRLEDSLVEVEFTVEDVDLGSDTTAAIEVKTLLGQHYLSVTPAGSGDLDENAVIPVERTSTPLNIVPAFLRLTEQTQAIDTDQVAEAFDALSSVLRTTAPEIRGTLRGLSRLSRAVTTRDDEIRELFAHAENVTGVVADRDQEITQLVRASNSVLEVLDSRRDTIARIIDGTSDLAVQLRGLVADNAKELEAGADQAQHGARGAAAQQGAARPDPQVGRGLRPRVHQRRRHRPLVRRHHQVPARLRRCAATTTSRWAASSRRSSAR